MSGDIRVKEKEPPRRQKTKGKKESGKKHVRWVITITCWTFFLSSGMSFASSEALEHASLFVALIILLGFVLLGILFDILGIATASAPESPFHAMASNRVRGARESVWLIKNAERVSNVCNDVIGDICGIISGTTGAIIVSSMSGRLPSGMNATAMQLIVSGVIAALTVGGKAAGKSVAIKHNVSIISFAGTIIHYFKSMIGRGND